MVPGPWPLLRALAALGEAIMHAALVATWIAIAVLAVLAVALAADLVVRRRQRLAAWARWWIRRRTARRFANAVADGQHETAEALARHALTTRTQAPDGTTR